MKADSALAGDICGFDIEGYLATEEVGLVGPLAAVLEFNVLEPDTVAWAHFNIMVVNHNILALQSFDPETFIFMEILDFMLSH